MMINVNVKRLVILTVVCMFLSVSVASAGEPQSMFNGRDLEGWAGDEQVWSVRDGQIVGSSVDHKIDANTFLIWQGGEVDDFRFTCKVRMEGDNNSGVQYRSRRAKPDSWSVVGYQADIHPQIDYTGMLYGEGTGRGIITQRGQTMIINVDGSKTVTVQDSSIKPIDVGTWHEFTIYARGNRLIHSFNGKATVDVTDNHPEKLQRGILALQVHAGPPMTVYFKDLVLEKFPAQQESK